MEEQQGFRTTDWKAAFAILQPIAEANAEEIVTAIRASTKTVAGARPLLIK
ncbi:MAG: hypothetical protein IPK44_25100 [Candidatus Accumulibacter sp.]|uniref:hypothetical protein n=1 Tax=Accumulibacter sp. TaxID=2053492 RepID=UPI0025890C3A|nr:hypothetical protein [Accumulibacter sp.]MBK8117567.1 hypothetical protein [Accumulibacter sp.]